MRVPLQKHLFKKISLHQDEYGWADTGVLIRNDVHTIVYLIFNSINPVTRIVVSKLKDLLFKIINPATRISVSNLKDDIEKSALAKFGSNVKKPY